MSKEVNVTAILNHVLSHVNLTILSKECADIDRQSFKADPFIEVDESTTSLSQLPPSISSACSDAQNFALEQYDLELPVYFYVFLCK